MSPDEKDNCDDEERDVDDHHDQDGEVKQVKKFISISTYEARLCPKSWVKIRVIWENVLKDEKRQGEEESWPPAKYGVKNELQLFIRVLEFLHDKGAGNIKTHDCHPREHGDGADVAKITNKLAHMIIFKFEIENNEKKCCKKKNAANITQDYLPMDIIEFRENPVNNEDNAQEEKADDAKDGKKDDCRVLACRLLAQNKHQP